MVKFSIFLPVHNGGEYIKQCIESIINQTYESFNVEILDNKSDDGTSEWLNNISDPRIRIWPSDRFLSIEQNWHRILDIPKNEYMTIIGHDDFLYPQYLETIFHMIIKFRDAKLFQTHFDIIDENNNILRSCWPMNNIETRAHFLAMRMCFAEDSFGTGYMMKSEDYVKVGGIPIYHKLLFSDDELWMKIINDGYKITAKENCFAYRIHSNSTSGTKISKDFYKSLSNYIEYLKSIQKTDKFVEVILFKNMGNYINYYIPNIFHKIKLLNLYYDISYKSFKAKIRAIIGYIL